MVPRPLPKQPVSERDWDRMITFYDFPKALGTFGGVTLRCAKREPIATGSIR